MKALLIRPWANKKVPTVTNILCGEPMGIECISTLLGEHGIEVMLADFLIEKRGKLETYLKSFDPDIVGISSMCTDVENTLRIARETKKHNKSIQVFVGGAQASSFPESFFSDNIDFIFKATTRSNIKQFIDVVSSGDYETLIEGVFSSALGYIDSGEFCTNDYIVPDRDISSRYRNKYRYVGYQPCALLHTAYGCRNQCTFCIRWRLEGSVLREAPIEDVVNQIESLSEQYFFISDNDFLINENRLMEFCDLLEKRAVNKKFMCFGSVVSILEKPHILQRLHANGLVAISVGFEAFDDSRLSEYEKPASVDENVKAIQILKANGIACWGSFIVHPDWDKDDFKELKSYIKRLQPELLTMSPLVPHPMTPLYEQYKDRLIYAVDDYEKWNFADVVVIPSKMPLRQYYWQVMKLAFRLNSFYSIKYALRSFPLRVNLSILFGFRRFFAIYIKKMLAAR